MNRIDQKAKSSASIDENLKRVYDEMLEEEIPDRFIALLDQLKAQETPNGQDDEK